MTADPRMLLIVAAALAVVGLVSLWCTCTRSAWARARRAERKAAKSARLVEYWSGAYWQAKADQAGTRPAEPLEETRRMRRLLSSPLINDTLAAAYRGER